MMYSNSNAIESQPKYITLYRRYPQDLSISLKKPTLAESGEDFACDGMGISEDKMKFTRNLFIAEANKRQRRQESQGVSC